MIKLFQFNRHWGMPNVSPFGMKLETYLRMAKLPYECVFTNDPRRAPKGKLPYIDDDGKVIADTGLIIHYLKNKFGDTVDAHLTAEQRAIALAFQRLCEEHLYWVIYYNRWVDPNGWHVLSALIFRGMPRWKVSLISRIMKRKTRDQLYQQGMGRHTAQEVYQLGLEDLRALSVQLEKGPYFFGAEPCSIDACVFSFLSSIWYPPIASPLKEAMQQMPHLVAYCDGMKQRYFSDL